MIKYRPQRGGLSEAMAEAREFESYDDMFDFVCKDWNGWVKKEDIVLTDPFGDDDRIGWKNVRHICIAKLGNEDYIEKYGNPQCIAWCGE